LTICKESSKSTQDQNDCERPLGVKWDDIQLEKKVMLVSLQNFIFVEIVISNISTYTSLHTISPNAPKCERDHPSIGTF